PQSGFARRARRHSIALLASGAYGPWPGAASPRGSAPAYRHAAMSRKTPSERSAIPRGYGTRPPSRPVVARSRGFAGQILPAGRTPRRHRVTCAGPDTWGNSRRHRHSHHRCKRHQDQLRRGLLECLRRQHGQIDGHDRAQLSFDVGTTWVNTVSYDPVARTTVSTTAANTTLTIHRHLGRHVARLRDAHGVRQHGRSDAWDQGRVGHELGRGYVEIARRHTALLKECAAPPQSA